MTDIYADIRRDVEEAARQIAQERNWPAAPDLTRMSVGPTRDPAHGDVANNAAMLLAGQMKMKPRDVADLLVAKLANADSLANPSVAGPGFINAQFKPERLHRELRDILSVGTAYGTSLMGGDKPVNVEYVSANPTGPMHVGHARGAVVGDALANLLAKAGWKVTREYYINDAGAQVESLARSVHYRYREALGEDMGPVPEGLYPGDYLVPVGKEIAATDGARWHNAPEAEWLARFKDAAIDSMMALIRNDLAALGVRHDQFTSERHLVQDGAVDAAVKVLEQAGLVYTGTLEPPKGQLPDDWEPRPQMLFRATQFGDDSDRPLRKSDGSWTYFATDIAYHFNKFERGFNQMIDVWGADHGGYVKRVKAAVKGLSGLEDQPDVQLCQMVNLLRNGEPVKMSKRSGNFVTLRELVDEVGADVVRFIMLTRRNDAHLDFDLAKVVEETRDNPVFYVQYAHARAHSVARKAQELYPDADFSPAALAHAPLERLTDPAELALIRLMAGWPRLVEGAAEAHEPHRIAYYLNDLAAEFHGLWNKGRDDATLRFLDERDRDLSLARLALVMGMAQVVGSGLGIFGVTPVTEMR